MIIEQEITWRGTTVWRVHPNQKRKADQISLSHSSQEDSSKAIIEKKARGNNKENQLWDRFWVDHHSNFKYPYAGLVHHLSIENFNQNTEFLSVVFSPNMLVKLEIDKKIPLSQITSIIRLSQSTIEEIHLNGIHLKNEKKNGKWRNPLIEKVNQCNNLSALFLNKTFIRSKGLKFLENNKLIHLDLEDNLITKIDMDVFLHKNPNLTYLNLRKNTLSKVWGEEKNGNILSFGITDPPSLSFLKYFPSLTCLFLDDTNKDFQLFDNTPLIELIISNSALYDNFKGSLSSLFLEKISLLQCDLDDDNIDSFINIPTINTLELPSNYITCRGLKKLINHKQLTSLNLFDNDIIDPPWREIFQNKNLTSLNMGAMEIEHFSSAENLMALSTELKINNSISSLICYFNTNAWNRHTPYVLRYDHSIRHRFDLISVPFFQQHIIQTWGNTFGLLNSITHVPYVSHTLTPEFKPVFLTNRAFLEWSLSHNKYCIDLDLYDETDEMKRLLNRNEKIQARVTRETARITILISSCRATLFSPLSDAILPIIPTIINYADLKMKKTL